MGVRSAGQDELAGLRKSMDFKVRPRNERERRTRQLMFPIGRYFWSVRDCHPSASEGGRFAENIDEAVSFISRYNGAYEGGGYLAFRRHFPLEKFSLFSFQRGAPTDRYQQVHYKPQLSRSRRITSRSTRAAERVHPGPSRAGLFLGYLRLSDGITMDIHCPGDAND